MFVVNCKDVPLERYGEGMEKRVMIGPQQGAPNFVMRVFDLPPGASSPYHSHDWVAAPWPSQRVRSMLPILISATVE